MTNRKSLLIIDDDEPFLQALTKQIELHEEFILTGVTTGESALEKTKADTFDAIILDVGLPDMNGREVCRLMRRNGVTAPIIMQTGSDTDTEAILGLDAGANDYIAKPFRIDVLLARLRAHVR
jgi:DNA-binding response OmpR family regulator